MHPCCKKNYMRNECLFCQLKTFPCPRYGTLHLPAEFFNERGTMSLTTLLAFFSLYTQTSSSLPKTSYAKNIDVWYLFSLCYLSLIITVHIATCATALSGTRKDSVSTPMIRSWFVVGTRGCDSKQLRTSVNRDIVILKISRVAFALVAIIFYFIYFVSNLW